ncbi:MAG: hypothetical protein MK165_04940 [Pirellulaceae bacterium]|nr:hypothetical protein [Pirellulaceae bacterium]
MIRASVFSRRCFVQAVGAASFATATTSGLSAAPLPQVTPIATRRELFVEKTLIAQLSGGARLQLHQPTPREIVLVCDRPWEGSTCAYMKVFRDADLYRMYYRGSDGLYTQEGFRSLHPEVACYAESRDGIHWTKPELGLVEFEGSKKNNIIWKGSGSHNFAPFLDTNPDCPQDERYKALAGDYQQGLQAFVSADGVRFTPVQQKPVISQGAFDSLNLAFWDSVVGTYREYHRDFRQGRDIRTGVSEDFVHWSDPEFLTYEAHRHGTEGESTEPVRDDDPDNQLPGRVSQLYTNQILPYFRAPHIYLGFPTRYIDRGWSYSATQLPNYEYRQLRGAKSRREGTAITDGMFMASRDGNHFHIWPESFIRPGLRKRQSWFYGDAYQNHGLVETAATIDDAPPELSVFVSEGSHQNRPGQFRRHTLRMDGFVSLTAPLAGGELQTRPLTFQGNRLSLNLSTSAAGSVYVEIQDADGKPIPGYTLAEAHALYGDSLRFPVAWKTAGTDVSPIMGKPVRLRFVIRDANVFSYRFEQI